LQGRGPPITLEQPAAHDIWGQHTAQPAGVYHKGYCFHFGVGVGWGHLCDTGDKFLSTTIDSETQRDYLGKLGEGRRGVSCVTQVTRIL
jgi:hypothetical protein